jgi:hypothetical protein
MHVETAGLRRATDEEIWRFARDYGFAIQTQPFSPKQPPSSLMGLNRLPVHH